jgi:hypothetical protein
LATLLKLKKNLRDLREIHWGDKVEWNQLAQDRDQWWALVNMVMNFQVLVP